MNNNFAHLRLSIVSRVAWLEFNCAPINAFRAQMIREVRDANSVLSGSDVRVLVLTSGIEGYFSAAADLHVFKGKTVPEMRCWVEACHDIARLLRASPKPLMAAINGTAVGRGLEMTLHCDLALLHLMPGWDSLKYASALLHPLRRPELLRA